VTYKNKDKKGFITHGKDSIKHSIEFVSHGASSKWQKIKSYKHAIMSDPELDNMGFSQCQVAGKNIKEKVQIVLTSPLLRSVETTVAMIGKDAKSIILMPYISEIIGKRKRSGITTGRDNALSNPSRQERLMKENEFVNSSFIEKVNYQYVTNAKQTSFISIANKGDLSQFLIFLGGEFSEILAISGVTLVPDERIKVYITAHSHWMIAYLLDKSSEKEESPYNVCIISIPAEYKSESSTIVLKQKVRSFHENAKNTGGVNIIYEGLKDGQVW